MENIGNTYRNYGKYHYDRYYIAETNTEVSRQECFASTSEPATDNPYKQRWFYAPACEQPQGNYIGGYVIRLERSAEGERLYRMNIRELWSKEKKTQRKATKGYLLPLSLELFAEEGFDIPVTELLDVTVSDKLMLEALREFLGGEMWSLTEALLFGMSLKEYADEQCTVYSFSSSAMYHRLYRKMPALREQIKKFLKNWQ